VVLGRVCTAYYFLHFLVILPILGKLERTLPLPESIARPVIMPGGGPLPSGAAAKPMEKA
jgi:ubiquinol-cytochrome c reductase cytochrome b subunit